MIELLTSDEWQRRLLRTEAGDVLRVAVANSHPLVGFAVLMPT